jgi:acetyltransferase-like isoleucine patch superfamily enzyme
MLRTIAKLSLLVLPWGIRRRALQTMFGYDLHPTSRIGLSWIYPKQLRLGEHASIGHLTFSKGLDLIELGPHSSIGNLNWITAHPVTDAIHFHHVPNRVPSLVLEDHAAITAQHFLDCASSIRIGRFSTVAGLRSQFFTHSIDIHRSRQDTRPIRIGSFSLIGTGSVILPGASVPDYSVVSACSMVNTDLSVPYFLYGGTPARPVKELPEDCGYFTRSVGYIK